MGIRNAAKAIVLHGGKILLDQCYRENIGKFFTLPGGGQHQYETMEAAVVRECLEETGYTVVPEAFVALYEEIHTSDFMRQLHPDYAHRIFHIFRCSLADVPKVAPSEEDGGQTGSVWIDVNQTASLNILPAHIGENMSALIHATCPLYLGTHFLKERSSDA